MMHAEDCACGGTGYWSKPVTVTARKDDKIHVDDHEGVLFVISIEHLEALPIPDQQWPVVHLRIDFPCRANRASSSEQPGDRT